MLWKQPKTIYRVINKGEVDDSLVTRWFKKFYLQEPQQLVKVM